MGEQCFGQHWMLMERTADPSASLGMTKGGTVFWSGLEADGGNCRSLGFARDDKGGNSVLVKHRMLDGENCRSLGLRSG